ncbi:hypothetical protein KGO95_01515 [Patescibacteria group bacterium]|nr:hypothetical protein [Patescibacteria group bacterium]
MGKALLATTIVGIALVGAVFLIQKNNVPTPASDAAQTSGANNIASSQPFVEKAPIDQLAALTPGTNLTQEFGDVLAQEISNGNPGGPTNLNGQNSIGVPNADTFAQNLISQAVTKFDPSKLSPVVNDSDLHIIQDNSKAAVMNYVSQLHAIVVDEAHAIPSGVVSDNPTIDQVTTLVPIYKDMLTKVFALSVPSVAIDIQKKELELLMKKAYILSAIANYKNDPVTTILVSQELVTVDQEFSDLSNSVKALIQKYSA